MSKLICNASGRSSTVRPGMQPLKWLNSHTHTHTHTQMTHCSCHNGVYPWPGCPPAKLPPCRTSSLCSSFPPPGACSPSAPRLQSAAGTSPPGCLHQTQDRIVSSKESTQSYYCSDMMIVRGFLKLIGAVILAENSDCFNNLPEI